MVRIKFNFFIHKISNTCTEKTEFTLILYLHFKHSKCHPEQCH